MDHCKTLLPTGPDRTRAGLVRRLAVAAVTVGALHGSHAAAPSVSEADMDRARAGQPVVSEQDMLRARERTDAATRALTGPHPTRIPTTGGPRIDALPQPLHTEAPNLDDVAGGYRGMLGEPTVPGWDSDARLLVFVSLGMPDGVLRRLVDQASRARATVLIRGMVDGSMRRTVARIQSIPGASQRGVLIDPRPFDRYGVNRVPAFVLARPEPGAGRCDSASCTAPDSFAKATGDVSLDHALEHFERAAPAFSSDAAAYLRRMQPRD